MSCFRPVLALVSVIGLVSVTSFAAQAADAKPEAATTPAPRSATEKAAVQKCETHGVKKSICARCKPKLAATYKSKGDWCSEHERPESQCAICNPELKKKGVKP